MAEANEKKDPTVVKPAVEVVKKPAPKKVAPKKTAPKTEVKVEEPVVETPVVKTIVDEPVVEVLTEKEDEAEASEVVESKEDKSSDNKVVTPCDACRFAFGSAPCKSCVVFKRLNK